MAEFFFSSSNGNDNEEKIFLLSFRDPFAGA